MVKYRTVTEREGEWHDDLPIDWAHEHISKFTAEQTAELREMEKHPERFEATADSGWPAGGWRTVFKLGMWDGWPYWKPTPTILAAGIIGGAETLSFVMVSWRRRGL